MEDGCSVTAFSRATSKGFSRYSKAPYFIAAIKLEPNEPLYHYQLGTVLAEARDDFITNLRAKAKIEKIDPK